jgi:hypothetical protein
MPESIRKRTLAESLEFLAGDILDHPARHGLSELSILLLTLASQAQDLQDRCDRAEEAAAGSYGSPTSGWYPATFWMQPGGALPVPSGGESTAVELVADPTEPDDDGSGPR